MSPKKQLVLPVGEKIALYRRKNLVHKAHFDTNLDTSKTSDINSPQSFGCYKCTPNPISFKCNCDSCKFSSRRLEPRPLYPCKRCMKTPVFDDPEQDKRDQELQKALVEWEKAKNPEEYGEHNAKRGNFWPYRYVMRGEEIRKIVALNRMNRIPTLKCLEVGVEWHLMDKYGEEVFQLIQHYPPLSTSHQSHPSLSIEG